MSPSDLLFNDYKSILGNVVANKLKLSEEVTLVTVAYNSAAVLPAHFESLLCSTEADLPRWIVVDNSSTDDSQRVFQKFGNAIEVISNAENIGFGAACNIGIAAARTRYVMVLNPDTALSITGLRKLLVQLKSHSAAIAGPRLKASDAKGVAEVESLVGAILLMDRNKMDAIGYFDEQFFLYKEDRDLCRRALQAGLKIIQCYEVDMPHEGASSTSRTLELLYFVNYHKGRSFALYASKHDLPAAELEQYIKENHRRRWIARLSGSRSRYLRAKGKLDGVNSVIASREEA